MSDQEPIVILDDDAEFEALPSVSSQIPDTVKPVTANLQRITGAMLRDLVRFSQERVRSGEGSKLLADLGCDQSDLVQAYGIGYMPKKMQNRMPKPMQAAFAGVSLFEALIFPATDESGHIVDFLCVHCWKAGAICSPLFNPPRGLIGRKLIGTAEELVITTSVRELANRFRNGQRNVLLQRNIIEVERQATVLKDAGVRRADVVCCRGEMAGIRAALHKAGILLVEITTTRRTAILMPAASRPAEDTTRDADPSVTPSPVVPKPVAASPLVALPIDLTLAEHNPATDQAIFTAGPATYVLTVPSDHNSRLEVAFRLAGQVHRDRFDLAVEAQRKRFAGSASLRTGVDPADIESHLTELLDRVRALVDAQHSPAASQVVMGQQETTDAMAFAKSPDLLDRIRQDLDALGWVGEETTKAVLYLAAVSRKLPKPTWAALRASAGAGKSHGLEVIAGLVPPEDVVQVSRLTDTALYYQNQNGLSHKLLIVDEADALTPQVVVALRVLKSRGALTLAHVNRSPTEFANPRAAFSEVRGPVAVLTSTTDHLDDQLLSRCFDLPVDESSEQTQRILSAQRKWASNPSFAASGGERARIQARHHALQRLLQPAPVVIPFAERIAFPATSVRHRRDQERFLALIEASAILHQHQRLWTDGCIVADLRDFDLARELVDDLMSGSHHELSRHAHELLRMLFHHNLTAFTMPDLLALRLDWTRYTFRSALRELIELEYVTSPLGGKGRKPRNYHVIAQTGSESPRPGITLLDQPAIGELATIGETDFANISPCGVKAYA